MHRDDAGFFRAVGTAIEADSCPSQQPQASRLASEPETEWWVHVNEDESKGWWLAGDTTVRVVRRERRSEQPNSALHQTASANRARPRVNAKR